MEKKDILGTEPQEESLDIKSEDTSFGERMKSESTRRSFDLTIDKLIAVGAQFGQRRSLTHPRMYEYIHQKGDGSNVQFTYASDGKLIIDLDITLQRLKNAYTALESNAQKGGKILFVCTKKTIAPIVEESAKACGAFFVTHRWAPGILTNFLTLNKNLKTLYYLKKAGFDDSAQYRTKKERISAQRKAETLEKEIGGLNGMKELPGTIIVVGKENIATKEAKKLGLTVVGIIDTNIDPTNVDHVIPCNDDTASVISLVLGSFKDAILNGNDQVAAHKTVENIRERPAYNNARGGFRNNFVRGFGSRNTQEGSGPPRSFQRSYSSSSGPRNFSGQPRFGAPADQRTNEQKTNEQKSPNPAKSV